MAFTKKTWLNRITQFPNRRTLTKSDGSTDVVTVARNEGTVTQQGTELDATNMNDLEERIRAAVASSDSAAAAAQSTANTAVTNAATAQSTANAAQSTANTATTNISKILGDFATVETGSTASKAYAIGDYLVKDGYFYRVTAAIAQGNTLTVGGNIVKTNVGAAIKEINDRYSLKAGSVQYDTSKVRADYYPRLVKRNGVAFLQLCCTATTALTSGASIGTIPTDFKNPVAMTSPIINTATGLPIAGTFWIDPNRTIMVYSSANIASGTRMISVPMIYSCED